jgi:hypothetical protein
MSRLNYLIQPVFDTTCRSVILGVGSTIVSGDDAGKEDPMLTAKDDAALAGSVRAMDALVSRLRAKIVIIDGLRASISSAFDHLPDDRDDDLRRVLGRSQARISTSRRSALRPAVGISEEAREVGWSERIVVALAPLP